MAKALGRKEKAILADAGFTAYEIKKFDNAKTVDGKFQDLNFASITFQRMISSRRQWRKRLTDEGWTPAQIKGTIEKYYRRRAGRSPFDFLKIEYQPAKVLSDYAHAIKQRARTRITRDVGAGYGRGMKKQLRPKAYLLEKYYQLNQ